MYLLRLFELFHLVISPSPKTEKNSFSQDLNFLITLVHFHTTYRNIVSSCITVDIVEIKFCQPLAPIPYKKPKKTKSVVSTAVPVSSFREQTNIPVKGEISSKSHTWLISI